MRTALLVLSIFVAAPASAEDFASAPEPVPIERERLAENEVIIDFKNGWSFSSTETGFVYRAEEFSLKLGQEEIERQYQMTRVQRTEDDVFGLWLTRRF